MKTKLRAVPAATDTRPPDHSYEWRERQRIASRDWARVHVDADRREPVGFFAQVRRTWR